MTSSSSHHPDSSSASSTPRANGGNDHHGHPLPPAPAPPAVGGPQVRLMCSFGGRILPRPGDRQLRYVGGETRIVSFPRAAASYAALVAALAKVAPALFTPGAPRPALKYQLPQDDLDSLISVSSDDDVDHLMDELDRLHDLATTVAKPPRLRVFLFAPAPDSSHASSAFGSVLSGTGGEAATDQWFVDALNAPAPHPIERGRSEASSIISEVPDYLFGLDTASDEPSPGATAARNKSETEMAHHGEDEPPAPAPSSQPAPYVVEGSSWPAPPPSYMAQPVYYFPVPPVRAGRFHASPGLPHCRWRRKRGARRSPRDRRRLRRPAPHAAVPADDVRAAAHSRLHGGGQAAGGRWGSLVVGVPGASAKLSILMIAYA